MAKSKKKPPSRVRYELAHPVVTLRLTPKVRDRLKAVMADAGLSAAEWVKVHLDEDETKVIAIARQFALERDGLGEQLRSRRRDLAEVERLLGERRRKLDANLDEEMKTERQRRLASLETQIRAEAMSKGQALARVDQEIRAKQSDIAALDSTLKEKHGERLRLDLELGNRERLKRELAEEALAELRRQGVPYMACLTCPGYIVVKSVAEIARSVVGSRPPSSAAGKPSAPASQPQGSPAGGPATSQGPTHQSTSPT